MGTHNRRVLLMAAAMVLAGAGIEPTGSSGPTTLPAATRAAVAKAEPGFVFDFREVPFPEVLAECSKRLGVIIVSSSLPRNSVTIVCGKPLTPAESVALLRDLLLLTGYGFPMTATPDGYMAGTVVYLEGDMVRTRGPIYWTADADKIPADDSLITEVMPLENTGGQTMANAIASFASGKAQVSGRDSSLLLSGEAARIRDLVRVAHELDRKKTFSTLRAGEVAK